MNTTEILTRTISGMPVEVAIPKGAGMAFVFVNDEIAGSVEMDSTLSTWGAYTLHRTGAPSVHSGMWGAIDAVVREHVEGAMKAVLAR